MSAAAFLAVPLAEAIGRWGCLAAGRCGGWVSDSRMALYLPNTEGIWATRYPTQMLASRPTGPGRSSWSCSRSFSPAGNAFSSNSCAPPPP